MNGALRIAAVALLVVSCGPAEGVATMDDPALSMRLPADWKQLPAMSLRSQAEQGSAASTRAVKEMYDQLISEIDGQRVRLYATGPSGFDQWQATIIIEVTDAGSVNEQIDKAQKLATAFGTPTTSARTDVKLAIGQGVRLENTADPPASGGVAARGIDYVVQLADGRILWINTTAPAASTTFADTIDKAIGTIGRC